MITFLFDTRLSAHVALPRELRPDLCRVASPVRQPETSETSDYVTHGETADLCSESGGGGGVIRDTATVTHPEMAHRMSPKWR